MVGESESCVHRTNLSEPKFSDFSKKPIGKEKVTIQGEGTQKLDAQLPYKWGYDESLYTICGCILKAAKKHVLD